MTDAPGEKKIIVDEDWKRRVEAEREELAEKQQETKVAAEPDPFQAMPPASLEMLLTTLATEAMMALGQIPHPVSGKQEVRLSQAKYFVDTIEVLRTKTQGNLTPDEQGAIDGLLHQLRLAYVTASSTGSGISGSEQPPSAS